MNATPNLEGNFDTLVGFFDHFGAPAEGFSSDPLSDDQRTQLEALARGDLGDDARKALIPLLISNNEALSFLARQA